MDVLASAGGAQAAAPDSFETMLLRCLRLLSAARDSFLL